MLFAFSTASCAVRNVRIDSTGPKISSRAMRWLCETFVNSVGRNQNPRSGSRTVGLIHLGALVDAGLDELLDPLELLRAS